MDFEQIVLTKYELKLLRKAQAGLIPAAGTERLKRLGLAHDETAGNPGYMPQSTGMVYITDFGVDYLAYLERRFVEYRKTRVLAIIAIVISVLSLLCQALQSLWTRWPLF